MLMKFNFIPLLVIMLIAGAIFFFYSSAQQDEVLLEQKAQQDEKTNNEEIAKDEQKTKEKLTTTLSPARDLTGEWEGGAVWTNNVINPACSYEGTFYLSINQDGNNIDGTFISTIIKTNQLIEDVPCSLPGTRSSFPLEGTLSSSTFEFTVTNIIFLGTFTSDLMKGTLESCPDQICLDGTRAVGFKGDFNLLRKA